MHPGGHLKFPHLWPLEMPPPHEGTGPGRRAKTARLPSVVYVLDLALRVFA